MSIMRGTKPFPNSFCKRSASACLRTEPNTRNPLEIRTFVVPQPIPVETPVTTTSLLFAIAFFLLFFKTARRSVAVSLPAHANAAGHQPVPAKASLRHAEGREQCFT